MSDEELEPGAEAEGGEEPPASPLPMAPAQPPAAELASPTSAAPADEEPRQAAELAGDRVVVLITGATDGIGKQAARLLARHGVHVIVHGRSTERVEATLRQLRHEHAGASVEGVVADFASLHAVHALADRLAGRRIDVLVNNAGVYMREREVTQDGFEATFGINYLAPFVLTHRLLPVLAHARGRVVQVSSVAHLRCRLDWDNLQGERHYDDYQAYALSKLALVLLSAELARRLGGAPPTVNAMHPGVVSTKLLRAGFGVEGVDRIEHAAAMLGYLALADDVAGVTGKYFAEGRVARAHALAGDPLTAGRFYELTASLVGVAPLPRRRATQG